MRVFRYRSGEDIMAKDQIAYHGEHGEVQFVVNEKTGDAARDWYVEQNPDGGVMLRVAGFGDVFLTQIDVDEDLEFISRAN